MASEQHAAAPPRGASRPAPPEDRLQHWLLGVWTRLLGRTDLGIDDDFFALGGTREQSELVFAEIARLCHERLSAPERGALTVRGVSELLVARFEARARTQRVQPASRRRRGEPAVVRNILSDRLLCLWEELLGTTVAGIDDDFFALGGTRELCERMLRGVEDLCGERIEPADVDGPLTVRRLRWALVARLPEEPVTEIQAGASGVPPLFFLHGDLAGGGYYVRELAHGLGPEQPVFLLQQHGMHGDDVPPSIEEMAAEHAGRVAGIRPAGPVHVGGHCIGGILALEMARQLARAGREITSLLMIDPPWRLPQGEPMLPPPPLSRATRRLPGVREAWLSNRYRGIAATYRLTVYPGRTVVFWTRDSPLGTGIRDRSDAQAVMEQIVPHAEVHTCIGTHVTALGRHVRSLAATMKAALAAPSMQR